MAGIDGIGGVTSTAGGPSAAGSSSTGGQPSSCEYPAWEPGATYFVGDIVNELGQLYIATHDNPGYEPTVSTWYWSLYSCGVVVDESGGSAIAGSSGSASGGVGGA